MATTMPKSLQQKIKNINRRLATLERKGLTKASAAYRNMMDYATRTPMSKNAKISQGIYNVDYRYQKVRLKTAKDWEGMSKEEQLKLQEVVDEIWNNPTSSTSAYQVEKSLNESYETFLKHNPQENFSKETYAELWRAADRLRAEKNSHFSSDQVIQLLNDFNISDIVSSAQLPAVQQRLKQEHSTALEYALSQYNEGVFGGGRRLAELFPNARRRS